MVNNTVLGMELIVSEDSLINTCQALNAFVVVKALSQDGEVVYLTAATSNLHTVECLGMAEFAALRLRKGLA
jgi:hypothetical protein